MRDLVIEVLGHVELAAGVAEEEAHAFVEAERLRLLLGEIVSEIGADARPLGRFEVRDVFLAIGEIEDFVTALGRRRHRLRVLRERDERR